MKILARLLIGLVAAGALLVLTINWIAPTALSFYSTYKAPKVAGQLPRPCLRGFQEGDPTVRQDGIALHLFSKKGSVEFIVFQKDYQKTTGVTQAELNRIVQTTHPRAQSDTQGAETPGNTPVESRSDVIR